jgi:dipeptidyl aminopeptidase/acylaminoacyl peptidase
MTPGTTAMHPMTRPPIAAAFARWCGLAAIASAVLFPARLDAQEKRAFVLADMFAIDRVGDPQLSPDGKRVLFTLTDVLKDENRTNSDVWIAPVNGGGTSARPFAVSPKGDRNARWSPDGSAVVFVSTRGGSSQLWLAPADSGEPRQLTTISTGADQPVWSPDGKSIAFVSAVYPEFSGKPFAESDRLNAEKDAARDTGKVKARIFTQLLYRHWDSWVDDKRLHIFVVPAAGGQPRDVTPGDRDGVPTSSTFSGGDEMAFSPDGSELSYTATPLPVREQAWSTNHDILTVNLSSGAVRQVTTNPAADGLPRYSPDGQYIAYRAQARPGFEADQWKLMLYDRKSGKSRTLTGAFDTNVDAFAWDPSSKKLYIEASVEANAAIWSLGLDEKTPVRLTGEGSCGSLSLSADGSKMTYAYQTLLRPAEVFTMKSDGADAHALTDVNGALFSKVEFSKPEVAWVTGAMGVKMHMWVIKPPFFDPKKKYPMVYMVHGGPQGDWGNSWSFRWCPSLWAAQGYVIALPNPRGSTSFGQQYTDEISRDWGGKVYDDLMAGVSYMESLPFVDGSRMAAAGASYGGYMMNWMMGHTDKFKTFVTHDGVFNFTSMYGSTEEVWFDEWEHGIPWETADYDRFSPHKYAQNFKTPTLIIHGELDYRIPFSEAQQLFTTLQRKGIPSKLLYFPDEGHWVLKPANSELWHKTVFGWLAEYLKGTR